MNYVDVLHKFRRTYEAAGLREEAKNMAVVIAGVERLIAERNALRNRIALSACGTVVECGDDENGQPRVLIHSSRRELMRGPSMVGKRVYLVVEDAE